MANALESRGVTSARAAFRTAYHVTFLAQERVRVAANDYPRIRAYDEEAARRGAPTIADRPCAGGEPLPGGQFLCPMADAAAGRALTVFARFVYTTDRAAVRTDRCSSGVSISSHSRIRMPPVDEQARLAALRRYRILDTDAGRGVRRPDVAGVSDLRDADGAHHADRREPAVVQVRARLRRRARDRALRRVLHPRHHAAPASSRSRIRGRTSASATIPSSPASRTSASTRARRW